MYTYDVKKSGCQVENSKAVKGTCSSTAAVTIVFNIA